MGTMKKRFIGFVVLVVALHIILPLVCWHGCTRTDASIFLRDGIWHYWTTGHQAPSNRSIPKIIHQTFRSEMVYENYRQLIRGCLALNPDWKYYLWRDSDALALIRDEYPQFLTKYTGYRDNLERSDSIRYIVLHHFGGIYLDMDVECIRPFYPTLSKLPAFIDQERTEQTNIIWSRSHSAMNSVMGSVAGHAFFHFMIDAMLGSRSRPGGVVDSTGPHLLTLNHAVYAGSNRDDWLSQPVLMLPPAVFSPSMDTGKNWRALCRGARYRDGTWLFSSWRDVGCHSLANNNWGMSIIDETTIGIHRFMHLGYAFKKRNRGSLFNVSRAFSDRVNFYSTN